jgi:hypothetical protein
VGSRARVNPASPRAAAWARIFGGDAVPLLSPIATSARAEGLDGVRMFYRVDVDALDAGVAARIRAGFCRCVDDIIVWQGDDGGLPGFHILASDVIVAVDGGVTKPAQVEMFAPRSDGNKGGHRG